MRPTVATLLLIASVALFIVPSRSFAQASDTLVVSAMPPGNLNTIINGDTTATGQREDPNRVYVLQQTGNTDSTYFFTAPIYMLKKFNLTIVGKDNPVTGMPPVIEPFINADNSTPAPFVEDKAGNITVKNLYFLDKRTDGVIAAGNNRFLDGSPDSATIRVDHCVFDDFTKGGGAVISFGGNGNNFFITSTEFRNVQSRNVMQPTTIWTANCDTIECVNDTYFCTGYAAIWSNLYLGYLLFEHNTMFANSQIPLRVFQVDSALIENNIFYALYAHGLDSTHIKAGGAGNLPPSIITFDSLYSLTGTPYNLTEAGRHIVVKNNAYYWPKAIFDNIAAINDTATDKVVPPTWMNSQTSMMFTDHTAWPGLTEANNDSVDPGFSPSLVGSTVDSLVEFVDQRWSGQLAGSSLWRQDITNPVNVFGPVSRIWATTQGYPVPENLAYSNTTLQDAGSDGFALGDLNWFPVQLAKWELTGVKPTNNAVPTRFDLSQNYPNPFNPSTDIKVSLSHAGVMSLMIYNVLGQVVQVVDHGYEPAGEYIYNVNMDRFASGVYFYSLKQGANVITKKMLLLK